MFKEGDWLVYCDICGQRCWASESSKLDQYTGRGGLIVCKYDVDKIDYGLVPYIIPLEKNIPWTRINHTDTTDGSPIVDLENMTLTYYLTSSQDNIQIVSSQDGAYITTGEPL